MDISDFVWFCFVLLYFILLKPFIWPFLVVQLDCKLPEGRVTWNSSSSCSFSVHVPGALLTQSSRHHVRKGWLLPYCTQEEAEACQRGQFIQGYTKARWIQACEVWLQRPALAPPLCLRGEVHPCNSHRCDSVSSRSGSEYRVAQKVWSQPCGAQPWPCLFLGCEAQQVTRMFRASVSPSVK